MSSWPGSAPKKALAEPHRQHGTSIVVSLPEGRNTLLVLGVYPKFFDPS